jgi:hypothetical protein
MKKMNNVMADLASDALNSMAVFFLTHIDGDAGEFGQCHRTFPVIQLRPQVYSIHPISSLNFQRLISLSVASGWLCTVDLNKINLCSDKYGGGLLIPVHPRRRC